MMMEQQTILNSDERWKSCIRNTCYAVRMVKSVKDCVEKIKELVMKIINNLKDCFNSLKRSFERFTKLIEECEVVESHKNKYPKFIKKNFNKLNTSGFHRPITKYARSRC